LTSSVVALISLSVYGFVFAGWTIGTNTTANVSGTYDSLANGLVAHYTFDGASVTSTTVADDSGNGNTGTIAGDTIPTLGRIGQGMSFDGSGDYVNTQTFGNLGNGINNSTFSAWLKTTQTTTGGIVGTVNGGTSMIYELNINRGLGGGDVYDTTGYHQVFIRDNVGATRIGYINNPNLIDGDWHYIAWVISGATISDYTLYVDGVSQTITFTDSGATNNLINFGYPLFIGTYNLRGTPDTHYFNGSMDDVRIYNRAL